MPRLFQSVDPREPDSVGRAANALSFLLKRLAVPRSVAELRLEADDVEWLRAWGSSMSVMTARWSEQQWLLGEPHSTRQQAFGLVFLALAAETARREAAEGHVWGPVRRRLSDSAASVLFSQGQPRQPLKDALESACRLWQLRHVFGHEGQQAWYTSVYLQFGFTERTIESRLPARLANAESVPTAVHHLLHDQRLRSQEFSSLWNMLISVRRHNVSDARARQALSDSPWVLAEWIEALLEAAVSRMELTPSSLPGQDAMPSLFTVPRLEWAEGQPEFSVDLVNLADVAGELPPGPYRCRAGSVTDEFTIDDLGTPHGLHPIRLPLNPSRVTATIEQYQGNDSWAAVAGEELFLWEPLEEVAAFREDGTPVDAWRTALDTSQPYTLILAPGLTIMPPQERWANADGCLVVPLTPGWSLETGVYLGDEKIWDPKDTGADGPRPLSGWSIPATGTSLGELPKIQLYGLSEIITEVRADRQPVTFDQQDWIVNVLLPAAEQEIRPSVLVRTRDTTGKVRVGRIPITWLGAQHLSPDGWVSFPVREIDERDLGQRIRAFTPEKWREPTLLVGNRSIGRVSSHGRARGSVTGWGAQLLVADGQFNREPDRELLLADSVTSRGVIQDLNEDDLGDVPYVTLRHAIDLSEVNVYAIDRNGIVEKIEPTPTGERSWILDKPPENALVVVYRDELIGARWRRPLAQPESFEDAVRMTRLVRNTSAPLLSGSYASWVRGVLNAKPAAALVWLFEPSTVGAPSVAPPLPEDLAPVVRELLDEWEPDSVSIAHMAKALHGMSDKSIKALADICQRVPVPASRLLVAAFGDAALRRKLRGSLLDALGWGGPSSATILDEIGWQFNVDGRFLERLARIANDRERACQVPDLQRQNLLVAMNLSGDYRRWLAGHLISEG